MLRFGLVHSQQKKGGQNAQETDPDRGRTEVVAPRAFQRGAEQAGEAPGAPPAGTRQRGAGGETGSHRDQEQVRGLDFRRARSSTQAEPAYHTSALVSGFHQIRPFDNQRDREDRRRRARSRGAQDVREVHEDDVREHLRDGACDGPAPQESLRGVLAVGHDGARPRGRTRNPTDRASRA
ncbi:MAG: hypothetical protein CEN87_109 [Parcubacteria group bacterium Licking1014_1]|nr:MAG: hypothetical protein CEN87_109 [Parcubacteria group bacterium Licking1014_1]